MPDKIYLEITNVCNLSCSFCHKTKREKRLMTAKEFDILTDKLKGKIRFLYFHLMGEPTLHPLLPEFIRSAREKGFLPMLTTNGSLLGEKGELLLQSLPHKISISLHAPEANPTFASDSYLDDCILFAKRAAEKGCIVALRLWNLEGNALTPSENKENAAILGALADAFPLLWKDTRSGKRLGDKVYLEWGETFDWPDMDAVDHGESCFCYGLRDQIGVLVDGTVVPCCLDADGKIPLGNLLQTPLEDILNSPRARAIKEGFDARRAIEPLCRHCGYAQMHK